LWSSSWSFGGFGAKAEEKPKSAEPDGSSYFSTKKFSDFNFGFGSGGADSTSFDIGDSKKDDILDDDEPFPNWGNSSLPKKEKKKKVGIEEVDDTLPAATSKDTGASWGWDSKDKKSANITKAAEDKKDPWAPTSWGTAGKKDTKSKSSWADLVEEDEEEEKAADPLAAVLEENEKTEDKGWGSTWGTTAAKKDPKAKKSIWDVDDSPKTETKKDDDPWGDFAAVTKPKPGKKGKDDPEPDKPKDDIWGWAATDGKKGKKDSVVDPTADSPKSAKDDPKKDTAERPPLSILKGLTVSKDGTLKNEDGVTVGEVIEGDVAKLVRLMLMCDEEGNIKSTRGKVLGTAQTVPQEKPAEEETLEAPSEETADLSVLEGLVVDRDDHKLYDADGVAVGELVDGDAEVIVRRKYKCTAEGTFLDRKLTVVGRAKLLDSAKSAAPEAEDEPEPVDISILEGLAVESDGQILDIAGIPVGKLVEGDAKIISKRMYLCNAEGIFRDKKLKQVGRAEVIQPEKPAAKEPEKEADEAEETKASATKSRTLADLEGLTCDEDGKIFIDDVAVAELVEGKTSLIFKRNYACNADGEILDKKGQVIGRVELLAEEENTAGEDEKAVEEEQSEEKPTGKKPSRTLADLQGFTCEEDGNILIDGVAVAKVVEGDIAIMFKRKYVCTADGEVLNKKKGVHARVELIAAEEPEDKPEDKSEEEAAEDSKEEKKRAKKANQRTFTDLEGLCCDADGKFRIDDVVVAEVVEGDAEAFARRKYTCNADGDILNKVNRAVGRAELVAQEEPDEDPAEQTKSRTLADLEGLSCDAEGKIIIDDIVVAELVDGDAQTYARRKYVCNADGGVLNKKGVVVGRVELVAEDKQDEKPEEEEATDGQNAASSGEPPLSILDGFYIEKDGKVNDNDGNAIGEVIEGDASKMSRMMYMCNAAGEVLDFKDQVVGKVRTLPRGEDKSTGNDSAKELAKEAPSTEKKSAPEAPPLSILKGLFVEPDGKILNILSEVIGEVTEGDAKSLSKKGATCDDEGNIILKKKKVGKAKTLTPDAPEQPEKLAEESTKEESTAEEAAKEEPVAAEPPPLSILKGRTIESDGKILNDEYEVIGEVIEGDATKMYTAMATCDAEGNIKNKKKILGKARTIAPEKSAEEPAVEEPVVEETPADTPSLAILDGRPIAKSGDVLDDDGKVIGRVLNSTFSHNKLYRGAAKCDAEGNIIYSRKNVGTVELVLPEKIDEETTKDEDEPKEEEEAKSESPSLAILEGRTLDTSGEILDDDGKVIGKLISTEYSAAKISKAKAKCDANGKFFYKGKEIGTAELVIEEKPLEETPKEEPEAKPEPPSLAILEGRTIENSGDILDDELHVIGKVSFSTLTSKKLCKGGAVCDAEGNILLKNREVGKAELVLQSEKEAENEEKEKEAEPEAEAETEAEPTPAKEPEAPSLAILDGRKLQLSGDVHDDDGNVIGKLADSEHSAKKLHKNNATCDAEGNVIVKNKKVGTVELVPQPGKEPDEEPEKEPEPETVSEPEPPSLAALDGRLIDKDGNVLDDDDNVIGKLVESSYTLARLVKNKATCDSKGNIICKGKEMGTVELVVPDKSSEEPPATEAPKDKPSATKAVKEPDFSILDGKKIMRTGEVLDDDYNVIAKLVDGSDKKLYKGKATCDAEGNAILNGLELGKLELVGQDKPAVEDEPADEPEPEPETEPLTFAALDGKKVEKSGEVLDDNANVIAKLVDGSDKKLYKGKATCDDEGNAILAGKKLGKLELVEQEKEAAVEKEPEPEPKPEPPTFAILKGRSIDFNGEVLGDDYQVIARLVAGSPTKLYKGTSVCDGEGNAMLRGREAGRLELVLPEVKEEKPKDVDEDDAWAALDWGTTTTKDKKKSEKTAKDTDKDSVKELLDTIDNPDDAWGDPWAESSTKKKKRDSVAASSVAVDEKTSKPAANDWDTWSNSTKSKDKKKKAGTPKSEKGNPLDDSKIMKPAGVDEPKAETEEESGFAWTNKKDKGKKKGSKNTPVEVDDVPDVPIHKAETVEETKSAADPADWEFASNRVKAKKGKTGTTPAKSSGQIARAPSPPDDAEFAGGAEPMKAIEAAPASGKKSTKTQKASSKIGTELSKSITKDSTKTKASGKSKDVDDAEVDEDDLGPDDSASGYNVSTKAEPPKAKSKKDETPAPKSSSGWGFFGGGASKNKKLADLRKEREERERKDKEEREKKEQQDREEEERLERERLEEERLEQERLEQEERDRAIKEAEEEEQARKEAAKKGGKKGKKTVATTSKTLAKEAPAPEPPAPEPAEEESSKKDDPFAIWGVQRKGSKKVASSTKRDVSTTNQDTSLTEDAKKVPEPEVLPIRTKSSAAASALPSSSIKATKVATKGASIAERIKALQGETKLKGTAAQTPPPPPPPAPVAGKASKEAEEPPAVVDFSSKKTAASKKSSAKTAAKSTRAKELESESKSPIPIPGGFPDSDNDEPLIDLDSSRPATPEPETKMGAKAATKSSKKVDKKAPAKATKATSKSKSSPAPEAKKIAKEAPVDSTDSDSDTEIEGDADKTAANAEGTQGSGSTTAVDDTQPVDTKTSTAPLEKSPAKKERPKVVRPQGGSQWGFWATATPKQMRQKAKEGTPAPLKGTSPPVMVRPRVTRKATAPEPEKSEPEKKTPVKPTPKRATTFSLFGATPTRSKSTRQTPTQKSSSRPQSRRASPERTDGNSKDEERDGSNGDDDEVPRVSEKAAKVMGITSKGGASASRRASVKSKGENAEITPNQASRMKPRADHLRLNTAPDPYPIDSDIGSRLDNGVDLYAESSPAAPVGDKKANRKSVATSTGIDATTASSANDDAPLVDIDGARATPDTDTRDLTSTSRKPSLARRSTSRANPRDSKGLMGIFGLSRSKTVKEPRRSDPTFGRTKRDSYASDAEYVSPKRSSPPANDDDADRRGRRERRKSRRDGGDDEGFNTDGPGVTTDYEEADRRRTERRAARKAEKEREREEARIAEERAARKRDREAEREKEREREARRAARKAREEEKVRAEEEARRRDEKESRRAAREDRRREESSRYDTEAQTTEKEDSRRRRRDRGDKEPRDRDGERPRGDRRRSSYMPEDDGNKRRSSYMPPEDDSKRRSSKRTPVERSSRRATEPVNDYFDARNANPSTNTTPYLGSDKDKTSSWVESVNKEPPLPIPPEDVATVIEEPELNGDRDLTTDDEEVRRRMQGRPRDRRRESTRDADAPRDKDREDRRRERKRRDRDSALPRSSDSGNEKDRRRKSGYDQYPDFSGPLPERPGNSSRRQSWFKKIF
jgi:hypothetical protein